MPSKRDVAIVRELAARVADIAALPVQEEKRRLWRALNGLRPERPMVMIDQVCWNEMNVDDELTLRCADPECRGWEDWLRRTLFQWERFPVDMVVEPFVRVPKAVTHTGFGVTVQENTAVLDPTNSVVGHLFINQFETDEDLAKVRTPVVGHLAQETERRMSVAHELFDGLLDLRAEGLDLNLSLWDPISTWMGVEGALMAIADRPDYVHRLVGRLTDAQMGMLDQLEEQGLLCGQQSLIHCTGAWTDELPGYDPHKPRCKDLWGMGLAQMFSTVSPRMFREYEVEYASRTLGRFGLVYYGCCDPLDGKMREVRMIPGVRKVSMSPWVNEEKGASEIGSQFVYSRKPNPALLAWDVFRIDAVRDELQATVDVCMRHGCPLELILKDISTVRYEPQRLFEWARVAMEVVGA
ncbi:MAG TPA: hypothetical protein VLH79_08410 [Chthonomonadales bacterium]|nr:hypothetical protein [Chthonomonadales bacterium]